MRAGGGLGVVLHREGRDVEGAQALDDVVVEPDVADLDAAVAGRAVELAGDRRLDREAVVVRGDLDAAGGLVEHRLVDAAVPERAACRCRGRGRGRGAGCRSRCRRTAARRRARCAGARRGRPRPPGRPGRSSRRPQRARWRGCPSIVTSCGSTCTSKPRAARLSIVDCFTPRSSTARLPIRSLVAGVTSVAATETSAERFRPAICGASRTSRSCSASPMPAAAPEKIPPRMLPAERM